MEMIREREFPAAAGGSSPLQAQSHLPQAESLFRLLPGNKVGIAIVRIQFKEAEINLYPVLADPPEYQPAAVHHQVPVLGEKNVTAQYPGIGGNRGLSSLPYPGIPLAGGTIQIVKVGKNQEDDQKNNQVGIDGFMFVGEGHHGRPP